LFVGMQFLSRLDREPVRHEVEQPIVDVGWVCLQDRRCATNGTIRPATFLKFGETSDAEEMAAAKPDRLECDRGTDEACIIVNVRYDGQKNLADCLHEKPR